MNISNDTQLIENIKKLGNAWISGDKHRVYLNNVAELAGLHCNRYKTGNISSASYRDEAISNSKASKLYSTFYTAKVWLDVKTGELNFDRSFSEDTIEYILNSLRNVVGA